MGNPLSKVKMKNIFLNSMAILYTYHSQFISFTVEMVQSPTITYIFYFFYENHMLNHGYFSFKKISRIFWNFYL